MADLYGNMLGGDVSEDTNNGFWSVFDKALPGLSDGIGAITSNVLPRYVESQLIAQQTNQMDRTLFNPQSAPPRVDQATPVARFSGESNLSIGEMAMIAGVGLVAIIMVIKL